MFQGKEEQSFEVNLPWILILRKLLMFYNNCKNGDHDIESLCQCSKWIFNFDTYHDKWLWD